MTTESKVIKDALDAHIDSMDLGPGSRLSLERRVLQDRRVLLQRIKGCVVRLNAPLNGHTITSYKRTNRYILKS